MGEFEGKAGIIVGGANGIGRAAALALSQLGAEVLLVDVGCDPEGASENRAAVEETARDIAALTPKTPHALALDVAAKGAAAELVAHARRLLPSLDFGLYCAGYRHDRALLRDDDDALSRLLEVHLFGAIRFTRELARELVRERREGSIVLASSAAAFAGTAGQSAHATASGGLFGFVRTAATELRRQGIRVNALVPTARTRLTAGLPLFDSIREDSLTPEHAAQVACHLLSSAAREVHGEVIGVAGGRIYGFRHSETSGAFLEGPPPPLAAVAAAWRDVLRRS